MLLSQDTRQQVTQEVLISAEEVAKGKGEAEDRGRWPRGRERQRAERKVCCHGDRKGLQGRKRGTAVREESAPTREHDFLARGQELGNWEHGPGDIGR